MIRSRRKRNTIAMITAMAVVLCMAAPVSAAYETTFGGFKCRGLDIPAYSGKQAVVINNSKTTFTAPEKASRSTYEKYSALDSKGRAGAASANIDKSSLPSGGRGDISQIYPTGWKQNKYSESLVEYGWLFNRSHLYAHSLGGDDIKKNLCTGCRAFNDDGMNQTVELKVLDHIRNSNDHVLYRVTPVFLGNEMLARGVLIEAESLESEDINICVFCYNVQRGIAIDYMTGANRIVDTKYGISVSTFKTESINTRVYTGKPVKPYVIAKDAKGSNLKFGRDFSVSYRSNVYPGKAQAVIRGEGTYFGSKSIPFYIKPARGKIVSAKSKKKSIMVKWKAQPKVSGYQIKCTKAGSAKSKTITVKGSLISKKIGKLKKKKKYSVQIRAYVSAGGKKLYGDFSKAARVKVR